MVDLSKLSGDLRGRIEKIMDGDGKDAKSIDSRNEYNQLTALLSGDGKVSGSEKAFVEGMITDYEEAYMVRDEVKERVRDLIKNGEANKADDSAEIAQLKEYVKTKGLTKEEKNWIKSVINGRVVKELETAKTKQEPSKANKEIGKFTYKEVDHSKKSGTNSGKKAPKEDIKTTNNPIKTENGIEPEPKGYPNKAPNRGTPNLKPIPPVFVPVAPPISDNDRVDEKDHFDDKDGVDNKGAVQQGGMGNVNVGPGSTVIFNNGLPNVAAPETDTGVNPSAPIDNSDGTKGTDKPSVEEAKKARDNGEKVADALLGPTSNTEQRTVQDIVNEEINSSNVIEFLKGYENGREDDLGVSTGAAIAGPIPGTIDLVRPRDHFFEQMRTEYNFPEKESLMQKVAKDLQGYLANKYGVNSDVAREVAIVLLEGVLEKKQTQILDKIYQEELNNKKNNQEPIISNPIAGVKNLVFDTARKSIE